MTEGSYCDRFIALGELTLGWFDGLFYRPEQIRALYWEKQLFEKHLFT